MRLPTCTTTAEGPRQLTFIHTCGRVRKQSLPVRTRNVDHAASGSPRRSGGSPGCVCDARMRSVKASAPRKAVAAATAVTVQERRPAISKP